MLTLDLMLKLLPVFALIVAIAVYMRRIDEKLDDMLELQWRTIDLLSRMLGEEGNASAFVARTGRIIRRRHV